MSLKIVTNNQPREIIYWNDLTFKEKKEFDYLSKGKNEDCINNGFVRYLGRVYDMGEFFVFLDDPHFKGWHGYSADSYFSGVCIKVCNDSDNVIMGRYFS